MRTISLLVSLAFLMVALVFSQMTIHEQRQQMEALEKTVQALKVERNYWQFRCERRKKAEEREPQTGHPDAEKACGEREYAVKRIRFTFEMDVPNKVTPGTIERWAKRAMAEVKTPLNRDVKAWWLYSTVDRMGSISAQGEKVGLRDWQTVHLDAKGA